MEAVTGHLLMIADSETGALDFVKANIGKLAEKRMEIVRKTDGRYHVEVFSISEPVPAT
jgi:hypothetical protein